MSSLTLLFKASLFVFGSTAYALLGIFSQLSKSSDGSYTYSLPSVVLTAEFLKLAMSCSFLLMETKSLAECVKQVLSGGVCALFAFTVPSCLYALNNNLDMMMVQHMDPATMQVLTQTKILTTSLVWWLVFKEPLGARKWISLLVLFFGAALASLPSQDSSPSSSGQGKMYTDSIGILILTLYVFNSAGAGVYNEWLYKSAGKDQSIHVANIRLYVIGVAVNLVGHVSSSPSHSIASLSPAALFHGYNIYTWGLVATYASMGLLIAQVMRWFDNIIKLFISGCAMYISALLSLTIFGIVPTPNFLGALALVSFAILLFNKEKIEQAMNQEKPNKGDYELGDTADPMPSKVGSIDQDEESLV